MHWQPMGPMNYSEICQTDILFAIGPHLQAKYYSETHLNIAKLKQQRQSTVSELFGKLI